MKKDSTEISPNSAVIVKGNKFYSANSMNFLGRVKYNFLTCNYEIFGEDDTLICSVISKYDSSNNAVQYIAIGHGEVFSATSIDALSDDKVRLWLTPSINSFEIVHGEKTYVLSKGKNNVFALSYCDDVCLEIYGPRPGFKTKIVCYENDFDIYHMIVIFCLSRFMLHNIEDFSIL